MRERNFVACACGQAEHNVWAALGINYRVVLSRLTGWQSWVGKSPSYTAARPQPTRAFGESYQQYYAISLPVIPKLIPTIHTPYINHSKLKKGILL